MSGPDWEAIEPALKVLANRTRLALLATLRRPRRLAEITVREGRSSETWGSKTRPLSRQAVRKHLDLLEEIGAVRRVEGSSGEAQYVLHPARVFEITEDLRTLATLRTESPTDEVTMAMGTGQKIARPQGPHLVVVRGVDEGMAHPLREPMPDQGWFLGRERGHPVSVEHDRYVSGDHCVIRRHFEGFALVDLPSNRNGTWLNWEPLARGAIAPLETGDLIGIGRTMFLFRAAYGNVKVANREP